MGKNVTGPLLSHGILTSPTLQINHLLFVYNYKLNKIQPCKRYPSKPLHQWQSPVCPPPKKKLLTNSPPTHSHTNTLGNNHRSGISISLATYSDPPHIATYIAHHSIPARGHIFPPRKTDIRAAAAAARSPNIIRNSQFRRLTESPVART